MSLRALSALVFSSVLVSRTLRRMKLSFVACVHLGSLIVFSGVAAGERPNLLWITVEDMSPTLGVYGDATANTPNVDAFAKESVRYTNAFAAAPVCSPSRSTLITGMWAPSLGTSQMR